MKITTEEDKDGLPWVVTQGLREYGQQEVSLPIPWSDHNWRNQAQIDVLNFIASYVTVQPLRIKAQETMRYGWTSLHFRLPTQDDPAFTQDTLIIQELRDPFYDVEPHFIDGIERAALLFMHQGATAYRLGMTATDYPHRSMYARVCQHIVDIDHLSSFALQRSEPAEDTAMSDEDERFDSLWVVSCLEPAHAHSDPREWRKAHLLHFVSAFPPLFSYLALPSGSRIIMDAGKRIIWRPGQTHPEEDTYPPFNGLQETSSGTQ